MAKRETFLLTKVDGDGEPMESSMRFLCVPDREILVPLLGELTGFSPKKRDGKPNPGFVPLPEGAGKKPKIRLKWEPGKDGIADGITCAARYEREDIRAFAYRLENLDRIREDPRYQSGELSIVGSEKDSRETEGAKSPYAKNPYRTLAAVWNVLKTHADKDKPYSVNDILKELRKAYDADVPSATTLQRILPADLEALNDLFPGLEVRIKDAALRDAYQSGKALHVVLEDRQGKELASKAMRAIFTAPAGVLPSYSTVDNLLKQAMAYQSDANRGALPMRLKCVVARGEGDEVEYLDYDKEMERLEEAGKSKSSLGNSDRTRRYYLDSVMEPEQWRILTDMIKVYPYISQKHTDRMLQAIKKIYPGCDTASSRYSFKKGDKWLFRNLELLDLAIRDCRRVNIDYGEYVLSQTGKPVLMPRKSHGEYASFEPYALMWSNGYYYLVGKDQGMMNLRVDRIREVELTEERFERPKDFVPEEYRDKSPVMYPGMPELLRLRCPASMIGVIMDFFGEQATYRGIDAETVEVMLHVAWKGAKLFFMQYADRVELLEPEARREELRQSLSDALANYA